MTDLQLANTNAGQTFVIYTYTGTGTEPNRRIIIEENRATEPDDRHAAVPQERRPADGYGHVLQLRHRLVA